jgi:hypothetical protein
VENLIMQLTPTKLSSDLITIHGEPAVPLERMPKSWQRIAASTHLAEAKIYTAMAQVFLAKHQLGHVLFTERPQMERLKPAYCEGNGLLAWEAVEHFGQAFLPEHYPDLEQLMAYEQAMSSSDESRNQLSDRLALIRIVADLFEQLQYDVPATFYWTFLHPLQRTELFEVRSFRFSEQDLAVARQFDAILHGGYVSMLRRLIDSVSSQHGYFMEHGCGCESHLAKLKPCDAPFTYTIPAEARRKTLRAFFWSILEEYLLFELRAATRLVYADTLEG